MIVTAGWVSRWWMVKRFTVAVLGYGFSNSGKRLRELVRDDEDDEGR